MAMEVETNKPLVKCAENEELADYMLKQWRDLKLSSDHADKTLSKAYSNLCSSKNPVRTLKEYSQIKGVGKWILKLMQGFFKTESTVCEREELTQKGKKAKGPRRYMPQKNSVSYALLITLYRATSDGNEFMRKQELIDAAEASGLSRAPIGPELGKGKVGQFGGSPRDWYSGWTSMKTLISKGLVVKSSCPAKYMLTQEGKEAARECITKSGLADPLSSNDVSNSEGVHDMETHELSDHEIVPVDSDVEVIASPAKSKRKKEKDIPRDHIGQAHSARDATTSFVDSRAQKSTHMPPEYMDRLTKMGYTKERILRAHREVSKSNEDTGSSWLSILCHLREEKLYGSETQTKRKETPKTSILNDSNGRVQVSSYHGGHTPKFSSSECTPSSSFLRPCSSSVPGSSPGSREAGSNVLSMPPLSFGESFEDIYDVILILDNREQFANKGSRSSKLIEGVGKQFNIQIEVRRLPVGDGIWIARHKSRQSEYVLDFIVERKNVDDLRSSIRDNRYRDQKLRLLRCGLKKLIYLVEGDPNASEAAESIKTACFTTEILDGFDVQRTAGLGNTLKKYGNLTLAISQYYKSQIPAESHKSSRRVCPRFSEFVKKCEELDKMTVNDLFAIQLMQVPQVTEDVAMAVVDLYPTIISLASAYSLLDGDISAQEELLRKESNNAVNASASRNIFHLVWGN